MGDLEISLKILLTGVGSYLPNNKYSNEFRIYPISTSQQNLVLIFNKSELQTLKELVLITKSENSNYASLFDINQKKDPF